MIQVLLSFITFILTTSAETVRNSFAPEYNDNKDYSDSELNLANNLLAFSTKVKPLKLPYGL